MDRILSVAPLSAPGVNIFAFLDGAASAGFDHVGLRLKKPEPTPALEPVMSDAGLQKRLADHVLNLNLKVLEFEAFWINPDFDIEAFKPCVELAAQLSPRYLLAVGNDPDQARLRDNFCKTVELGQDAGMRTALEFISYTAVKNLQDAQRLITTSETDAGLLVDALHLSRAGGSPVQIQELSDDAVCMLHFCDARKDVPVSIAGKREEARGDRLVPGEGSLPLGELVAAAPANTPIEIECPVLALKGRPVAETLAQLRRATLSIIST